MFASSRVVLSRSSLQVASVQNAHGYVATRNLQTLKQKLAEQIPIKQKEVKEIKDRFGEELLGTCTVEQALGGMRDVKSMVWETSLLDAQEGIRFRGFSIPELQKVLPKADGGEQPLPEGLLWLLLTGEVPTHDQTKALSRDLYKRGHVDDWVIHLLKSLPKDLHPMVQFNIGINALARDSIFAKKYAEGVNKKHYWEFAYEDSLNLIARLPTIASTIYQHTYRNGKVDKLNPDLDWAANFSHMMGYKDNGMVELMRLYQVIHSDHEGGNVSAHTTHVVGSALSDPYLSYSAGMQGLAGPLHGLANQEVLRWTQDLQRELGGEVTDERLSKAVWDKLHAGQVIPGFGHAVLRKTDPRYTCQREFALKHLPNDPLFKLVSQIYKVVPDILTKHGKTKNPWPNVDSHSGVLLTYYGLVEQNFYTVLFGTSRAIGVLSQLVWSRALGFPLERPKSVTTDWIKQNFEKAASK